MNQSDNKQNNGGRKRLLLITTIVLLLAVLAYGVYWFIELRHFEETDDAYVAGNVVQLTPQVSGTVVSIRADDTELVQMGKPLVELDRSDARVALEQAEAQLAQTVREVSTLYVNNSALSANVAARVSDVARARSDLARRQQLAGSGAVSKEEISHAASVLDAAESALKASREQLASNQALTDRTSVASHPNVQKAAAQLQSAYLSYARTTLPAPVTGYVAKRSVQIGQRVAPGAPLLSIIPLNALWVDANFKEVQIARMRVGQPVTLHSDLYGSDVTYHGKLLGLSAGTGSAFALLPTQNASGNWIKVVQRVPVRISLDPKELDKHPLRLGVSMQVNVDIANASGTSLAAATAQRGDAPAYETQVYDNAGKEAAAMSERIIAENIGARAGGVGAVDKAKGKAEGKRDAATAAAQQPGANKARR